MFGIIYKFTIVAKYKMNGCKPFYVGQHIGENFDSYWGSGSIWSDFVKRLKADFPNCWKKFIKREILYNGKCNKKLLNKLEEVYIRKEHALYCECLGGCNVLPGAAIENNPAFSERVKQLTRERMLKKSLFKGKKHKESSKKLISQKSKEQWKSNPNSGFSGRKHNKETRDKISKALTGRKISEETRQKLSRKKSIEERNKLSKSNKKWADEHRDEVKKRIDRLKKNYPQPMKGHHHTEETKRKLREAALKQFAEKGVPFKGHHHTEESKLKMSESHKKRKNTEL